MHRKFASQGGGIYGNYHWVFVNSPAMSRGGGGGGGRGNQLTSALQGGGLELGTSRLQVQRPNHSATPPPQIYIIYIEKIVILQMPVN